MNGMSGFWSWKLQRMSREDKRQVIAEVLAALTDWELAEAIQVALAEQHRRQPKPAEPRSAIPLFG